MQAQARAEARDEYFRLVKLGADFHRRAADAIVFGLETVTRQAAAWTASKQEPEVPISTDELDVDPYLLNCANGIVNLQTGRLGPHRRDEMITYLAPTDYDPSADMSEWEAFVLWCCDGDVEQARWLQIALGQALIGKQDEHILLFLYGTGGNGKTQLTDAIMHTIGDYGLESSADLITARGKGQIHTETTASLRGKRFVVCPEPDRNVHWNSERAKSLTGGDIIRARHLYGREFSFRPVLTMVVHGNYQPEVRDHSDGFRRRIRLVPFTNQVTPNERVTELGRKLAGPGVLRWLVEGAVAYASVEALPPSQRISAATTAYMDEQNHLKRWFDEWCVADPESVAAIGDMYSTYQFWCRQEGIQYVETKQALSAYLSGIGYRAVMRRVGGRQTRMFGGIRLIEMTVDDLDTI
jgi:putative DNA primase/helicase